MDTHNFSFENLKVYNDIRNLVRDIYRIQEKFPQKEQYALGDQIRRAAVSISANLAEGSGRNSLREKVRFIEISYGSLMEVFCELQTACDLEYITTEQFESLRPQFTAIAKMLSGLRNTFQNKITKTPLPDNSITNNL